MNKQPQQTAATRARILDAFWCLFEHQEIETITINQLSAEAGIHRSSFYRYFPDIYAVLEVFETQLVEALREDIAAARRDAARRDAARRDAARMNVAREAAARMDTARMNVAREAAARRDAALYAQNIGDVFARYADKLCRLDRSTCASSFKQLFADALQDEIQTMYGLPNVLVDLDYYARLMSSILLENLTYWYENKDRYSFQEVNAKCQLVIGDGLWKIHNLGLRGELTKRGGLTESPDGTAQRETALCDTAWRETAPDGTAQRETAQRETALCDTAWRETTLCGTAWHETAPDGTADGKLEATS